jgi:hypothetical protein
LSGESDFLVRLNSLTCARRNEAQNCSRNVHHHLQAVFSHANRKIQIAVNSEANARRIQMVESCFGSSGEQLLIPGRVLVGEGVLTKMCRKRPKPRQFFLFNDILVYGNIIIGKKKYNKQHIIPLEEVQLQGLDDTTRELSALS